MPRYIHFSTRFIYHLIMLVSHRPACSLFFSPLFPFMPIYIRFRPPLPSLAFPSAPLSGSLLLLSPAFSFLISHHDLGSLTPAWLHVCTFPLFPLLPVQRPRTRHGRRSPPILSAKLRRHLPHRQKSEIFPAVLVFSFADLGFALPVGRCERSRHSADLGVPQRAC